MNRTQFFATVRLAKATIEAVQVEDKGYKLTASVQHPDEEPEVITLMYKNEPRYFKSLNSIVEVFRSKDEKGDLVYPLFGKTGELCFKVKMTATPIAQTERTKQEEKEVKDAKAKA